MRTTATLRPLLVTAALVGSAGLALPSAADAAARDVVATASVLSVEDVVAAGLDADTGTLTRTGDAQLNDAGRYDQGCLHDKTIRAITGAKAYPAKGTGRGYADATFTSARDKEVYVTESVAQGRTNQATDGYVAKLVDSIDRAQECQTDPAQGFSYGEAHHLRVGRTATADYYPIVLADGSRTGGGVAVLRDGTRFGILSVSSGEDDSATTLSQLSATAADRLR